MTTSASTIIGNRYDKLDKIGQGGMGTVYRGLDRQTKLDVAIKHLKREAVGTNTDMIQRFRREGALLRELNHPNIVHLIDVVEADDEHYIIMEYVSGGSLSDLLRRKGPLPIERSLQIALDLADALTRAHRLGIIHRDLKPSNILIADDETPRLSDFGIAHANDGEPITKTGEILGTIAYLPPEALQSGDFNERGDIWSLGIIIYQMLTGKLPFDHTSPVPTLITAILQKPIPDISDIREDVPAPLQELLLQMLAKDPNQRVNSVRQVGVILESLLSGTPITPIRMTTANLIVNDVETVSETLRVPQSTITNSTDSLQLVKNAPSQILSFVGRQQDLLDLQALFNDPTTNLVTILGVGGTGKTRLALQLANLLAPRYKDGAYFVSMASVENEQQGMQAFADGLGFHFTGTDQAHNELSAYIREKQMLIVMDSFEQVIHSIDHFLEMKAQAPNIHYIMTSRERLNIQNEKVHILGGLEVPTAADETALQASGVQLFIQKAQRMDPEFDPNEHIASIVRIVQMLDGSPLGIQLAGGWLNIMEPDEVADEIADSLDFLESRVRDVPERQRSLRATFNYSWKTLSDEERSSLLALSIFPSSFRRDAAKSVAKASIRTLTTLADKSKITINKRTGDYVLHNMVKTFAREILQDDADMLARVQDRFVAFYVNMLTKLNTTEKATDWKSMYARGESEFANIREVWNICVERGDVESLMSLSYVLWGIFSTRNLDDNGDTLFGIALNKREWPAPLQARLSAFHGWYLQRVNQFDASRQHATRALEIINNNDVDDGTRAVVKLVYSYVLYRLGDYAEAETHAEDSVALFRQAFSPWALGLSIGNAGYITQMRGNYEKAVRYLKEAYEISSNTGNLFALAYAANNLGEAYIRIGAYDHADLLFKEANDAFASIQFKPGIAFTYANLGDIARLRRDFSAEAYDYFEQAIKIYEDQGDKTGVADTLMKRARFALDAGAYEEAHYQLEHSLVIYRNIGRPTGIILALQLLGEVSYALDGLDDAKGYFEEALRVALDQQSERPQLDALFGLASLHAERGQGEVAVSWLTIIANHASTEYETRERATRTLAGLEEMVSPEAFAQARAQTETMSLDQVVELALQ